MALRKKLGEILVEQGAATPDDVKRALGHQRQWGGKTGRILVEMGAIGEDQLTRALAVQSRMPTAKLKPTIEKEVASLVPLELAEKHQAIAFGIRKSEASETVYVAVADPSDMAGMDAVRFRIGKPVKFALAPANEIARLVNTCMKGEGLDLAADVPVAPPAPVPAVAPEPAAALDPLEELGLAIPSPASTTSALDDLFGFAPPAPARAEVSDELDALLGAPTTSSPASILDDLFAPAPPASPQPAAAKPGISVTRFTPRARPAEAVAAAPVPPAPAAPPTLPPAVVTGTLLDPEPAPLLELGTEDIAEPPTTELELSLDEAEQPALDVPAEEGSERLELALAAEQAAALGTVETGGGIDLPSHSDEALQLEDPDALKGGWDANAYEAPAPVEAEGALQHTEQPGDPDPSAWFGTQDEGAATPDVTASLFGEPGQDFSAGADPLDQFSQPDAASQSGWNEPSEDASLAETPVSFDGWSDAEQEAPPQPEAAIDVSAEAQAAEISIDSGAAEQAFDTDEVLASLQESHPPDGDLDPAAVASAPVEQAAAGETFGPANAEAGQAPSLAESEDTFAIAASPAFEPAAEDVQPEASGASAPADVEPGVDAVMAATGEEEEIEVDFDFDDSAPAAADGSSDATEQASLVEESAELAASESAAQENGTEETPIEVTAPAGLSSSEFEIAPSQGEPVRAPALEDAPAPEPLAANEASFDSWDLSATDSAAGDSGAITEAVAGDGAVADVLTSLDAPQDATPAGEEQVSDVVEEVAELSFDAPFDVVEDADQVAASLQPEDSPTEAPPEAFENTPSQEAAPVGQASEVAGSPVDAQPEAFENTPSQEAGPVGQAAHLPDSLVDAQPEGFELASIQEEAPVGEASQLAVSPVDEQSEGGALDRRQEAEPGAEPSLFADASSEPQPETFETAPIQEEAPVGESSQVTESPVELQPEAFEIAAVESDASEWSEQAVASELSLDGASTASATEPEHPPEELDAVAWSEPTGMPAVPEATGLEEGRAALELEAPSEVASLAETHSVGDDVAPPEVAPDGGLDSPDAGAEVLGFETEIVDAALAASADAIEVTEALSEAAAVGAEGAAGAAETFEGEMAGLAPSPSADAAAMLLEALARIAGGTSTEADRAALPPERLAAAALQVMLERGWISAEELSAKLK